MMNDEDSAGVVRDMPVQEMTAKQVAQCYDVFVRPYLVDDAWRLKGWAEEVLQRMMRIDTEVTAEAIGTLLRDNPDRMRDLLLLQRAMRGDTTRVYVCCVTADGYRTGSSTSMRVSAATVLIAQDGNEAHYAATEACLPPGTFTIMRTELIDCGPAWDMASDMCAIVQLNTLRQQGVKLLGVLGAFSRANAEV